jgi:hypothetical protein
VCAEFALSDQANLLGDGPRPDTAQGMLVYVRSDCGSFAVRRPVPARSSIVREETEWSEGDGMNDKVDETLHRALISKDEFKRAVEFVEAARQHGAETVEYEALLHSAIIFYARPFTNNEGPRRGVPVGAQKLTGVNVQSVLAEDFAFHERIVLLRMKVVAHSEAAFNPAKHIPLTIGNPDTRGVAFSRRTWHVASENLDLDVFLRIAKKMNEACVKLVFDVAGSVGRLQTPVVPE